MASFSKARINYYHYLRNKHSNKLLTAHYRDTNIRKLISQLQMARQRLASLRLAMSDTFPPCSCI
jgi:hypothetical protein